MAAKLPFLDQRVPIVTDDGRPTPQFIKWFQDALQQANTTESTANAAVPSSRKVLTGAGLSGGGDLTADRTFVIPAQAGVAAGAYGDATHAVEITVDARGIITNVAQVAISAGGGGAIVKIAQVVVAVATNTITFSAIPATSEDLIVAVNGQLSGAADFVWASLNSDVTAGHYQWVRGVFQNSGLSYTSGAASVGLSAGLMGGAAAGAAYADSLEAVIFGYARTVFNKKCLSRTTLRFGTAANQVTTEILASDWLSTAAVNRIDLKANSGNFTVGTVATLYGRG